MRRSEAAGVCEAAALAAAGPEGALEISKRKSANATCALARIGPGGGRKGMKRGRLSIVGIGPGDREWRTPEAVRHLWQADELVGYSKYLDLAGEEFASVPSRRFELGEEVARCKYALEQAALGRNIALVTSGDAGIYAMGSLVMELLEGDFRRVGFRTRETRGSGLRSGNHRHAGGIRPRRRYAGQRFLRDFPLRPADSRSGNHSTGGSRGRRQFRDRILQSRRRSADEVC